MEKGGDDTPGQENPAQMGSSANQWKSTRKSFARWKGLLPPRLQEAVNKSNFENRPFVVNHLRQVKFRFLNLFTSSKTQKLQGAKSFNPRFLGVSESWRIGVKSWLRQCCLMLFVAAFFLVLSEAQNMIRQKAFPFFFAPLVDTANPTGVIAVDEYLSTQTTSDVFAPLPLKLASNANSVPVQTS